MIEVINFVHVLFIDHVFIFPIFSALKYLFPISNFLYLKQISPSLVIQKQPPEVFSKKRCS